MAHVGFGSPFWSGTLWFLRLAYVFFTDFTFFPSIEETNISEFLTVFLFVFRLDWCLAQVHCKYDIYI